MEIRADFKDAENLIIRLREYAKQFSQYNTKDLSHLKNHEDFKYVYSFPTDISTSLEAVYGRGRDLSVGMIYLLGEFNEVGLYPTFKSYVASVEETIGDYIERSKDIISDGQEAHNNAPDQLWSTQQMILLYQMQVGILESLQKEWIPMAKECRLYREECGEFGSPKTSEMAGNSPHFTTIFEGTVGQAQIQQATHNSNQIIQSGDVHIDKLPEFIEKLKNDIDKLAISGDSMAELNSEITTIEAQSCSPKPKLAIVNESLATIRRILEGAGGAVAAQLLMHMKDLFI